MSDADLKRLKETLLKLDLAIEAMRDIEVDTLRAEIEGLLNDYRENYELHLALNREFDGLAMPPTNPGGVTGAPPRQKKEPEIPLEEIEFDLGPEDSPEYELPPPPPPLSEPTKAPNRPKLPPKPSRNPIRNVDHGTLTPPPFAPGQKPAEPVAPSSSDKEDSDAPSPLVAPRWDDVDLGSTDSYERFDPDAIPPPPEV